MIERPIQHITQQYDRITHPAVDLRVVDKEKPRWWDKIQRAIAPEKCEVIRTSRSHGKDSYGNPFVVLKGLESGLIFKSIHTKPAWSIKPGKVLIEGTRIGKPVLGGNSKSLHEHFEVLKKDDEDSHFNPIVYFKFRGTKYE